MKHFRYDYLFLGGAVTLFADKGLLNWEWWAIMVPFAILNSIYEEENFK